MLKFHINAKGKIEQCGFVTKHCKFQDEPHIKAESIEQAYKKYNVIWSRKYPILANTPYYLKV